MNDDTIHMVNNAKNTKKTHFKNPPIHWLFIESCGSLSLIVNKTSFYLNKKENNLLSNGFLYLL